MELKDKYDLAVEKSVRDMDYKQGDIVPYEIVVKIKPKSELTRTMSDETNEFISKYFLTFKKAFDYLF